MGFLERVGTGFARPLFLWRPGRVSAIQSVMYHYNPSTALEELNEDATLPNPVHVRDMMLRHKPSTDEALELNRIFLEYQKFFGETQKLGKEILKRLAV